MAVTIYEALNIIKQNSCTLPTQIIPIEKSVSRICAEDIYAGISLPIFDNSAMDGYALKGEGDTYDIIGKILAGEHRNFKLQERECVKILTGAKLPENTQSVIPQENVEINGDEIIIKKPVPTGANIRKRGEDITEGENILQKGETIDASHTALLASQGITHIKVYRKVRVAVFASGSELKLHFEKLQNSQIYNSNTPYLLSRVGELGCEGDFTGKSEDDIDSLKQLVKNSLDYDLILTSGGVSVGEADLTKEAFRELGMEIFFQKVRIKPGKPTTFGKIGKTLVVNLPGNPLACALNFEIFARFAINLLSGKKASYHNYIETVTAKEIVSKRPVANVIAGCFDGSAFVPLQKQLPGMVNVLNSCNGYIVIDKEKDFVEKGERVKFIPIIWNFTSEEFKSFITS